MNLSYEQFKKDFLQDLLVLIVVQMKNDKMQKENAQQIAKKVLEIVEADAPNEAFEKINKVCESYPPLLAYFVKRIGEYDVNDKMMRIMEVRSSLGSFSKGGEN